jgi:anti-sigma factor RsiW
MASSDEEREDISLWRRFRAEAAGQRASGCPEANLLAAYIDSRTIAPEAEAIEEHLALCTFCMDQVAGVRAIREEPTGSVAEPVLRRAKNLVPPSGARTRSSKVMFRAREALNWAALAAALLVVCYAGFSMGGLTAAARAEATSLFSFEMGGVGSPVPATGSLLLPAGDFQ